MNPTNDETGDLNSKNCDTITKNGSMPKWLGHMTKTGKCNKETDKNTLRAFADSLEAISYQTQVPEILNYESNAFIPMRNNSKPQTLKQEHKLSFTSQLFATKTPKNIVMSKTNYLIPNLKEYNFDVFETQDNLEKSWAGLNSFRKSHKGRLDSAKSTDRTNKVINIDNVFTPLSSNSKTDALSSYSPSLLENSVPIRSKSEMSYRIPVNQEWHGGLLNNYNETDVSIQKSKSSENVFHAGDSKNLPSDSKLAKSINDYRLKVAKEDYLRQEIINELLSDTNYKNDVPFERKLYDKTSKYKINKYEEIDDDPFFIPELPKGRLLFLHILSTWGDKYYVGLNGIEIFGNNGELVTVNKIVASPSDVNVLPECHNDPRVVLNLLDGVNRTQDDVHLWLAPFEKGKRHTITIEFDKVTTVAMIRIWNYNKSRIHSCRGVKDLIMYLDDKPIFKGEIAKACGGILGRVDAFGDTILFTTDNSILELISHHDNSYLHLTSNSQPDTPFVQDRPPTSAFSTKDDDRPYTGATTASPVKMERSNSVMVERLDLILLSNWGYGNMIGLTGLELILENDKTMELLPSQISCNTYNNVIGIERLINGQNLTINADNMWGASYDYTQDISITILLTSPTLITGLRIWNYNESLETTYAGASRIRLLLDGKPVKNPCTSDDIFLLRRAPGNLNYDFVQDVNFSSTSASLQLYEPIPAFRIEHTHKEEFYESSVIPEGFVVQFVIFSTWNDQYYCGLDGIELYDRFGRKIILNESNICAYPESVNVLEDVSGDVRTPEKLIDGINNDSKGAHSWLAPIIPKCLNRIYIVFDNPVSLSVIKLWNYSKTSSRGVKEFGILIDDLLVYNGILDKRNNKSTKDQYRTVVFTDDANVIEQELNTLIRHSSYGQEVVLLNDNFRSTTTGGSLPEADPALRPFTSVSPFNLIHTSHSH